MKRNRGSHASQAGVASAENQRNRNGGTNMNYELIDGQKARIMECRCLDSRCIGKIGTMKIVGGRLHSVKWGNETCHFPDAVIPIQ
ncbi:hypothetical protein KIH74_22680 [Kineosporia sp. J2-2]|uniref:Post-SET domain-containing protein n=1 Tax=Kineosporia corallincola TaxID=2835133 RepID=A0ABS5TN03_9ACTN|nr:hypothetical protein [Kineosporia corallincola]MBT0771764.1 hypothetical protein [Kineosporia corallincola]